MQQRERFVAAHRHGLYSMSELCARYGVSRKTGYKWLARFDAEGRDGIWSLYLGPVLRGKIDEATMKVYG